MRHGTGAAMVKTHTCRTIYRQSELEQWFHNIQKKLTFLALEMFLSPWPIWRFTAKKGVCQISNYKAN